MHGLLGDLRYALRALRNRPVFAAVAILTLALGIGANTAIFSILYAVLIRPLPYTNPDHLVVLRARTPSLDVMSLSVPDFLDWRSSNDVFAAMSAYRADAFNLTDAGEPERVMGGMVSADILTTLGVAPVVGRGFVPDDDQSGAAPVVMLGEGYWERRFGGDAGVVGRVLVLDGRPHTVVGVMPQAFALLPRVDVLVPIGPWMAPRLDERGNHPAIWAVARLRPGVGIEEAKAGMATVTSRLAEAFPATNRGVTATLTPLHESVVADVRPTLLLLFGAVAFVLLIACVNVANLLLTRATVRRREMALRGALGAGRWQQVRQLLVESVLIAVLGGAVGALIGVWGLDALLWLIPAAVPGADRVGVDLAALAFTFALSVGTGVLFGLVPAFQLSGFAPVEALKQGGSRSGVGGTSTVRNALVVAEMALALVLLVGAGLMLRSLARVSASDPGFDPASVTAARLSLPETSYADGGRMSRFFGSLLDRLEETPGIQSAGIANGLPLRGAPEAWLWAADRPLPQPDETAYGVFFAVSPGYLETMGIPILRGRAFTDRDTRDTSLVCVVDERLAERFFGDADPVGRRMILGPDAPPFEIVGVARSIKQYSLDGEPAVPYQLYIAYRQIPDEFLTGVLRRADLVVRSAGDRLPVQAIREAVRGIDPDLPLYGVTTMEELIRQSTALRQFNTSLLAIFAAIALLLAGVGLYGVVGYIVSLRTPEIGVRVALGASTLDVLRLIMGHGLALGVAGVLVGAGATAAVTGVLTSMLFGVSRFDPVTFAIVALLLLAVTLAACYIPARRASRIDPVTALRTE